MKKTLFSLMLSEDVVREVDKLASMSGTNRSNYVNQILAEHVRFITPEKRANDIFSQIFGALDECLEASFEQNDRILSAKSVLDYKYRPTMTYNVQLYREGGEALGELRVASRSQSEVLLAELTEFFRLMAKMESLYVAKYFRGKKIRFEIEGGKMSRVFRLPETDDTEALSGAISAYVNLFDRLLKGFLSGDTGSFEMETEYVRYLNGTDVII